MAGPEGGNATVSFLISLIFAPLPELSFGGSATVTEILAFPLGLKKKKERKKKRSSMRREKKTTLSNYPEFISCMTCADIFSLPANANT